MLGAHASFRAAALVFIFLFLVQVHTGLHQSLSFLLIHPLPFLSVNTAIRLALDSLDPLRAHLFSEEKVAVLTELCSASTDLFNGKFPPL